MDHRAFLSSLPEDTRRDLTTIEDTPALWRLAFHAGTIALLAAAIIARAPFWPILTLPLGVTLVFLFCLMHECAHLTVFRAPWANRAVGAVCGFILFLPPAWFRYFHLAHHRHTHDPAHDPELASRKPETRAAFLLHITGLPVWWSQARTLVLNALSRNSDAFVPDRRRTSVTREARLMLLSYSVLALASIRLESTLLLWIWIIPLLLGQPFLRLFLLAEHGRCAHVANMFENTRTTFTSAAIRFLSWNMPFHAEHHAAPTVPYHRLPELHALAAPYLQVTADGYSGFHRDYQQSLTTRSRG